MMDNVSEISQSEESYDFLFEPGSPEIIISGPRNGLLWRGEEANPDDLVGSLKKTFEIGVTGGTEHSPLANFPYIQSYPNFICASNTYKSGEEFIGFDNEQSLAGLHGFTFLIDTSQNIKSIPLCQSNLDNPIFTADYIGEQISEGPDYAIISKIGPEHILGATPSESVARDLGIEEKSFIQNSAYQGIFSEKLVEKLKEFSDITSLYKIQGDKVIPMQSSALSTAPSSVTFFNRLSDELESKEHTPLNYNASM